MEFSNNCEKKTKLRFLINPKYMRLFAMTVMKSITANGEQLLEEVTGKTSSV